MSPARPRPRRRSGLRWALPLAAATALVLTGCTAGEPDSGTFVLPSTDVVECQEHQPVAPSRAYDGDEDSDTVAMLDLLRYWNENGDKPFCDGKPATEVDEQWERTVARLRGG